MTGRFATAEENVMFVISLVIIAVLIAIDQIIKVIVNAKLAVGDIVEVIKFGNTKIFSLSHVRNSGAAWSMMEGKTWFLIGVPVIVCALGIWYMYTQRKKSKLQMVSLAMLVAGGLGNLIDRIRLHEVIDYIRFEPIKFPVFNFADICVVVGAVIFAVYIIFLDKPSKQDNQKSDSKSISETDEDITESADE